MAWRIDRDYLEGKTGRSQVGRASDGEPTGSGNLPTFRFRLRDDDDIVYYAGEADVTALDDEGGTGSLYEALLWGQWFAGCTDLQVRKADALAHGLTSGSYIDGLDLRPDDWVSIYG